MGLNPFNGERWNATRDEWHADAAYVSGADQIQARLDQSLVEGTFWGLLYWVAASRDRPLAAAAAMASHRSLLEGLDREDLQTLTSFLFVDKTSAITIRNYDTNPETAIVDTFAGNLSPGAQERYLEIIRQFCDTDGVTCPGCGEVECNERS